jgi:hypothetical protein
MQLASISSRPPHLTLALKALGQQVDHQEVAQNLLDELSGITTLVAKKFTNDRTAEGIQDALNLTVGCISLGISQAEISDNAEAMLRFLLHQGAEYVFQMGFRHVKALADLPQLTSVCDIDFDPSEQQRNLKRHFIQVCSAPPNDTWLGDQLYKREFPERKKNQLIIDCAKWLRKEHYSGPIKGIDLDANAVLTIAIIFGIAGQAPIVARFKPKDVEILIQGIRKYQLDPEKGWADWLAKTPSQYHLILRERMAQLRSSLVKKIFSQSSIHRIVSDIERHAGMEQDIEY